jgi:hypothetical protein
MASSWLFCDAVVSAQSEPIEFLSVNRLSRGFGADGVTSFIAGDWPADSITGGPAPGSVGHLSGAQGWSKRAPNSEGR